MVETCEDAILVPQRAVQEIQGQKRFGGGRGRQGRAADRDAERAHRDLMIVTRGLEGGERVIVEGLQKVRPGMQVKPEAAPPAGTPPAAGAATPGAAPPPAPAAGAGVPPTTPPKAPAAKPQGGG